MMGVEITLQEDGHRTWSIIRFFYLALIRFRAQFESYERLVKAHARSLGVDREVLRLSPRELAELLEFKNLESLRDDYILPLKEFCHLVFRTADRTDRLDRFVSDIFHEISILKEEHYTLKTYAPMYERDAQEVELNYIVDEAHVMFPQKLNHIRYLFGKALERMEDHLPHTRSLPIVVRSLYLHRNDDFVRCAYPDGLGGFYRLIYPLGAFDGFCQVAQSFYHSGFYDQALDAFACAAREYKGALAVFAQIRRTAEPDGSSRGGDAVGGDAVGGDPGSGRFTGVGERPGTVESWPIDSQEYVRDPRLTMRSVRAKIGRIRKRRQGNSVSVKSGTGPASGRVSGAVAE